MPVVVLCVAQFVVVLDATIVAITLPAVQADLGLSTTALGWVITAYTLTFGGCLLAAGRLADRAGRRRTFVIGMGLFGVASLACGLAPTGAALLAGRAVQGLGAALVSPAALALLTTARSQGPARARALGWWTAAAAGGGASGWVLGGLLSGLLDWRWVFFVNLPACAAAAGLAPRVLAERRDASPAQLDVAGTVLATGGLGALVLALTLGQSEGPAARETLGALAAAIALLAAFARVEARAADPLLSPALRRRPGVAEPNVVAAVLTASTTPPMFFCVLYAQDVLRLGATTAGLLCPPFNLAVIAGSLAGPRVSDRLGDRRAMGAGLAAVSAGALTLTAIAPGASPLASLVGGFAVMGGGLGVASVASTAGGTAALSSDDQGLASGLLSTSAQVGTVLGLAVLVPIAAARTAAVGAGPSGDVAGYRLGFMLAAALAAIAAAVVGGRARRAIRRGSPARPGANARSPGGCRAAHAATGTPPRTSASSLGRTTTMSPGARRSSQAMSAAVKPGAPSGLAATTIRSNVSWATSSRNAWR
jgi:EmrB/QacA subfamily drug resistance transporter